MATVNRAPDIFCKRLKEARLAVGISQRKLGIAAGLDELIASTRVNRYELGIHKVELTMAQKFATILEVPLAYFYCIDDDLADMVRRYDNLSDAAREVLMTQLSVVELEYSKSNLKKKKKSKI